jgi:lipid-A-disaccharide synthase-like uncharacterized protein
MLVDLLAQVEGQIVKMFVEGLSLAIVIGLLGQLLFTARFLVQWIASERAGKSIVPLSFWFFSLSGGLILLGYAIYRRDPVFIIGQATGVFIYVRNLMLIFRRSE